MGIGVTGHMIDHSPGSTMDRFVGATVRVDTASLVAVPAIGEIHCPYCKQSDRVRITGSGVFCVRCRLGTRSGNLDAEGRAEWKRRQAEAMGLEHKS